MKRRLTINLALIAAMAAMLFAMPAFASVACSVCDANQVTCQNIEAAVLNACFHQCIEVEGRPISECFNTCTSMVSAYHQQCLDAYYACYASCTP